MILLVMVSKKATDFSSTFFSTSQLFSSFYINSFNVSENATSEKNFIENRPEDDGQVRRSDFENKRKHSGSDSSASKRIYSSNEECESVSSN